MPSDKKCSNCTHFMEEAGEMKFKVASYSGFGSIFLGGWKPAPDNTQSFIVFRCPSCGKVDLYEPTSSI
jgi:hypothetical protein